MTQAVLAATSLMAAGTGKFAEVRKVGKGESAEGREMSSARDQEAAQSARWCEL